MGERIGVNTTHARKGAVQNEVRGLPGVEAITVGTRGKDIYTLIVDVVPGLTTELLAQIGSIRGVEQAVEIPQAPEAPADEAGLQPA